MGAATSDCIQRLRVLCAETERNLCFVRSAGGVPSLVVPQRAPFDAVRCPGENASGDGGQVQQRSVEVAKLQLSHASLADSLQQLVGHCARSSVKMSQQLAARGGEGGDDLGQLLQRMDGLASKLEGRALASEVAQCMARIQALQSQREALAKDVDCRLNPLQQAVPSGDDCRQLESLCSSLAANQEAAAAKQAQQAAALAQLGQRVDSFAEQLEGLAGGNALHTAQAKEAEAARSMETRLRELAAAQEEHTAQLRGMVQAQAGQPAADGRQSDGNIEQVHALQQAVDDMAQAVFELRVDMQNNNADMGIALASTRRQAEETQGQADAAAEQAEGAAARVKELEEKLDLVQVQLATLQRTVEGLASSQSAGAAAEAAPVPPGLADWLRSWLQAELEGIIKASASQEERLQQLSSQLGPLGDVAAATAALQARLHSLEEGQQRSMPAGASTGISSAEATQLKDELAQHAQALQSLDSSLEAVRAEQLQQATAADALRADVEEGMQRQQAALGLVEEGVAGAHSAVQRCEASMQQQGVELASLLAAVGTAEWQAAEAAAAAEGIAVCQQGVASLQAELRRLQSGGEPVAELQGSLVALRAAVGEAAQDRAQLAARLGTLEERTSAAQLQLSQAQGEAAAQLQELSTRMDSLGPAPGAQAEATQQAATLQQLQRGVQELRQGLELCVGSFAHVKQSLETRVGRMETAVAGALEEVAGQMAALQSHVRHVERSTAASVQHAQQAAAAATLNAAQVHQLVAEASQRSASGTTASGAAPPQLQASQPRPHRSRSQSWGEGQLGREGSGRGRRSSGAEQPPPAGQPEEAPPSPRQEKSLRELFGGASFSSSQRPNSTGLADHEVQEQIAQLERALANAGELDDVQREMLSADLDYLRSLLE